MKMKVILLVLYVIFLLAAVREFYYVAQILPGLGGPTGHYERLHDIAEEVGSLEEAKQMLLIMINGTESNALLAQAFMKRGAIFLMLSIMVSLPLVIVAVRDLFRRQKPNQSPQTRLTSEPV